VSQPRTVIWITTRVVLYHTNICTYVRRDKSHILQLQPFQSRGSCDLVLPYLADHAACCFRILRITQYHRSCNLVLLHITQYHRPRSSRCRIKHEGRNRYSSYLHKHTHTILYSLPVLPVSVAAAAAALAASAC
jgi:hypothetical protein